MSEKTYYCCKCGKKLERTEQFWVEELEYYACGEGCWWFVVVDEIGNIAVMQGEERFSALAGTLDSEKWLAWSAP